MHLVTLYPEPPRAADDALATRARQVDPGHELVGLIQEPDVGTLRFSRLRSADEVTGWLSRARHALVCGLYPSDPARQPGAIWAIVPHPEPVPQPPAPASVAGFAPTSGLLLRGVFGLPALLTS